MKTIRYNRQNGGHVARVTDEEARRRVMDGTADYAPKHWLKAALRAEASGDMEDEYAC